MCGHKGHQTVQWKTIIDCEEERLSYTEIGQIRSEGYKSVAKGLYILQAVV